MGQVETDSTTKRECWRNAPFVQLWSISVRLQIYRAWHGHLVPSHTGAGATYKQTGLQPAKTAALSP